MPATVVTLLTDFGTRDGYVAQMKASVLCVCPSIRLVDISHDVPPQNIRVAAGMLRQTATRFPLSSVHVAVVDPGVGTDRRILAAEIAGQRFVAPDNGLLDDLIESFGCECCVVVENSGYWLGDVSPTFHGRDIMAPVAAHWASGVELAELGRPVDPPPRRQAKLLCREEGGRLVVPICDIDRFGNCVLADSDGVEQWLGSKASAQSNRRIGVGVLGGRETAEFVMTYGQSSRGRLLLLLGSQGAYELSVAGGSAARLLGVELGDEVRLDRWV